MPIGQTITLRLVIEAPFPGVTYSLQNKRSEPVAPVTAGDGPVAFNVPVRLSAGPKFGGEFVRTEGPVRRFVYIAIGGQAGQADTAWSRRAKIDIHTLPADLLEAALAGKVLEARLPAAAKDGGPACGTVAPLGPWRPTT